MILTKNIEVTIINHNINHYKSLGYNVKCKQKIIVPIEHLSKGSHIKIKVCCDVCGKENTIRYQDYLRTLEYGFHSCSNCRLIKYKETCKQLYGAENTLCKGTTSYQKKNNTVKEKYGVDNVFQSEEIKEKSKKTCLEKYGCEYANQNSDILEKSKNTRIKKHLQTDPSKLSELDNYYIQVRKETYKNKKRLFQNWDGYDYYDGEYIKDNFSFPQNSKYYPTIDHLTAVFYGFINNITVKEICKMENLVVTKRSHNCSKRIKTESAYIDFIKNNNEKC